MAVWHFEVSYFEVAITSHRCADKLSLCYNKLSYRIHDADASRYGAENVKRSFTDVRVKIGAQSRSNKFPLPGSAE